MKSNRDSLIRKNEINKSGVKIQGKYCTTCGSKYEQKDSYCGTCGQQRKMFIKKRNVQKDVFNS